MNTTNTTNSGIVTTTVPSTVLENISRTPILDAIPEDLKKNARWCAWKKDPRQGKIPYNVKTGGNAMSNNPGTFYDFDTINHAYMIGKYDGIGIGMFGNLVGIDLDDLVDPKTGIINPIGQQIQLLLGTYCELSPSGTGLRFIGTIPEGYKYNKERFYVNKRFPEVSDDAGIEIYVAGSTSKFVTITGNKINNCGILDISEGIDKVCEVYMERIQKTEPKRTEPMDPEYIAKGLDRFADGLKRDKTLRDYWDGNFPGTDGHINDAGLMSKILYWVNGSQDLAIQYFLQSPWAMSQEGKRYKKIHREDYLPRTIQNCMPSKFAYDDDVKFQEELQRKRDQRKHNKNGSGTDPADVDPDDILDLLDCVIKTDKKGTVTQRIPKNEVYNYRTILENDPKFSNVYINVLSDCPEIVDDTGHRQWTDTDDAGTREYIEYKYGIYSQSKLDDAFRNFVSTKPYHPIHDILDRTTWDGTSRVETMLIKWLGSDDTPYNRECSRLLFAGGIHRIYDPGCKFDDCVVLIGSQGAGKSTFTRLLSMDESTFNSIKTISGQKGSEGTEGRWICEIEELMATVANDRSGTNLDGKVKEFLSRQTDFYRHPFDKRPKLTKRSCIFVGTTNQSQFLTDPTGNRRWYPVTCHGSSETIYSRKQELIYDIRQAWKEMQIAYTTDNTLAQPYARKDLQEVIERQQELAQEEDPWIGLIGEYLKDKISVCVLEIWEHAICNQECNQGCNQLEKLTRKHSNHIAQIVTKNFDFERQEKIKWFKKYGHQREYLKKGW